MVAVPYDIRVGDVLLHLQSNFCYRVIEVNPRSQTIRILYFSGATVGSPITWTFTTLQNALQGGHPLKWDWILVLPHALQYPEGI